MLSALLVLATAVGGLVVDGQPSNAVPMTITFDDGR
jgi:hypothetical protein